MKSKAKTEIRSQARKASPRAAEVRPKITETTMAAQATQTNQPAGIVYADGGLKSDFPRITGQGFPVNQKGKAIGPIGSMPETMVGMPEKEAEGKREPEAAGINDRLRASSEAGDAAAKI